MFNALTKLVPLCYLCGLTLPTLFSVSTPLKFTILFFNNFSVDLFSLFLIVSSTISLTICTILADNKYSLKKIYYYPIFLSLLFFICGLAISSDVLSLFIFYELLMLPSYFLVKNLSPNRRGEGAATYFLLWTQFGSFMVLLGLFLFLITKSGTQFEYTILDNIPIFVQVLVFFGFGVKIPLWPFHFWLSKTHVEANTSFSIFLSGILVKAAVFGLYKFHHIFSSEFSWFFISVAIISVVDASLKMCIQIDLKKLVAMSTVQEMGAMVIFLFTPSYQNYQILLLFTVFHTFISGAFFWIVDCIYRRFNSRVVYNISGVINMCPLLSFFICVLVYLFIGIPFTIKFYIEVLFFKNVINYGFYLLAIVAFFMNYVGILFFFKTFIFINFGNVRSNLVTDLTKKELYIFLYFVLPTVVLVLV